MITVRIDVNKIDKSKFFEGAKGKYLNLVLWETPNGKFGDYLVKQELTKEERASGKKLPILGNAKILERRGNGRGGKQGQEGGANNDDW
jgi:hypothetical protein